MAPIYSGGIDVAPADEDISALSTSLGSTIASSALEGFESSPVAQLGRISAMSAASGQVPDFGGPIPPALSDFITNAPEISRGDAQARVKAAGLEHEINVPNQPSVKAGAIDLMIAHAREANERAATIADGPRGFIPGALDAGTAFLVGAADPLNVAASFVPVMGEARYAKLMSSAANNIFARAAIRAGTGAAQGAAFSLGFLPLDWAANTSDGRDFTLTQALNQVLLGAGQFGVLHAGGGAMADFWRALGPASARKPLYPFAAGEPFERRAVDESAATHPNPLPAGGARESGGPAAAAPAEAAGAAAETAQAAAPVAQEPGPVPAAAPRGAPPAAEPGAAASQRPGPQLEQVLANPRVAERFANVRIDSDHRVPYGAGADVDDPNLVHVDQHVPHRDVINGVEYDPRIPVALHEIAEHDGMEHDGLAYPAAHRSRGEVAERAWVEDKLGPGAWPTYTRRWDGWLSHIEPETIEDVPEGLYTKPYPFKERERIERLQRHEAAGANERGAIAREVSTAVERAGRPRQEASAAGQLFAARYATRAARFGDRAGSALDLFRAEHLGVRRGDPNFVYAGRAFEQRRPPAPDLFAEREAEGQQNLPATERIGQGELAQRRADAPLRPAKEQKPMDVGLFSDDAAQKTLFQEGAAPPHWYYSAVGRAVEGAKLEKGTPEQWLATIKNTPGVKAEELEWLGLPEWLKAHRRAVTRQELADYVRANAIELREVEKGGVGVDESAVERMALDQPDEFVDRLVKAGVGRSVALSYRRSVQLGNETAIREVASALSEAEPRATKFGQYTLPGGENYRELLLTLPERDTVTKHQVQTPAGWGDTDGGNVGIERRGDTGADFRSGHWDEPNVLAHVRFDDRVTDGKKTLHVAEIQSDWHQAGRKRGYASDGVADEAPRYVVYERGRPDLGEGRSTYNVRDTQGQNGTGGFQSREEAEAHAGRMNRAHAGARQRSLVPDAPFKTTWPELALKRMIRYAAENGYDRLSWDSGETNAERYDLSKQIDAVQYRVGTKQLEAFKGEDRVLEKTGVEAKDLPDLIGKEAAERLLNKEPTSDRRGDKVHILEGLELKVGGEGMRGFYDKVLPAAANKLVKKFGAKVGESALPSRALWDRRSADDRLRDLGMSAEEWAALSQDERDKRLDAIAGAQRAPVHSIDLTPQLREAAVAHGFPLFQGGAAGPRGRITLASNRVVIDLFKSADASTFLHEAGHLWLEELMRDAAHDEAPAQIRDDLAAVLKWLGVDKPEDIATKQHEQWARGFEQYLMEGRAPSRGLAAVFEKFRAWLAALYRSVSALDVPLSDEVRGVMDRMLASDPEIAAMQRALRALPDNAKTDVLKAVIGAMSDGKKAPAAQMLKAAGVAAERPEPPHPEQPAPPGEQEAQAARQDAFRQIAEQPAPENEDQALATFKAAEALP
jgi:hypothetical protein